MQRLNLTLVNGVSIVKYNNLKILIDTGAARSMVSEKLAKTIVAPRGYVNLQTFLKTKRCTYIKGKIDFKVTSNLRIELDAPIILKELTTETLPFDAVIGAGDLKESKICLCY
jgi:hypothetical protein